MPKYIFALAALLCLLPAVPARADVVVKAGQNTNNLPPSLGFTADCDTWDAGSQTRMVFWARNDDTGENAREITLVHGVFYPIDVEFVEDFDEGFCITVDDSSSGGFTRTRQIMESHPDWEEGPVPMIEENSGFFVNAAGPTYTNWRLDDREGYYDTGYSGFRYFEILYPGVFYQEDIARWLKENYSDLTSLVTVAP